MKKKAKAAGVKKKKKKTGKKASKKKGAKKKAAAGASRAASLADFCGELPGATEDIKWGDNLIFSVGGKMFAGFEVDNEHEFAFKCDEDDFERLTTGNPGVIPAPYAAKYGWVKVMKKGALKDAEARGLLRKAHGLIAACLSGKKRRELGLE